ncbi:PaaX family transcriptional regulator C-terminal domain-containing protein [Pseudomonas marincola]|uniref:PaaX family transcriptional regulator C-terminal domain-containing protein n=1 Tax=Pseudomonas marincola TaxID=437900 RepID=UPI0008E5A2AE|nr:PaaX family transcriptional regulator C-terminal domain-containing protein [Pseudomonas marincola]SFT97741.1 transcriptional regulator, PaaX family [Pseudomonas marincola]
MKNTAKSMILDLLVAAGDKPLLAREAVAACALFGISENSVRVALARLSAESLIKGAGRGSYKLGPNALQLSAELAAWQQAEQRMRPWAGDYLLVYAAALGRTDRTALRQRERALQMLGFCELQKGLYIRPNNIEDDIAAVRQRLLALGLEPQALVFTGNGFTDEELARIRILWDGAALTQRYQQLTHQLNEWLASAVDLEPEVRAREVFVLGSAAIRQVLFDPLLPEPFVDAQVRHAFVECAQNFVAEGRRIWLELFANGLSPVPVEPACSTQHPLH